MPISIAGVTIRPGGGRVRTGCRDAGLLILINGVKVVTKTAGFLIIVLSFNCVSFTII
jgi:hypothetical protein